LELGSKETWALITWLVFATYLHARITKRKVRKLQFGGLDSSLFGSVI
jgi:ABC-type transport system involved in cytochrome c biogenesis permease subunit